MRHPLPTTPTITFDPSAVVTVPAYFNDSQRQATKAPFHSVIAFDPSAVTIVPAYFNDSQRQATKAPFRSVITFDPSAVITVPAYFNDSQRQSTNAPLHLTLLSTTSTIMFDPSAIVTVPAYFNDSQRQATKGKDTSSTSLMLWGLGRKTCGTGARVAFIAWSLIRLAIFLLRLCSCSNTCMIRRSASSLCTV